jgi:parvulin-like peptidyl-prolyl isomerase
MFLRFASQVLILSTVIFAQQLPAPDPKIVIDPEKPDQVIATVDGQPFTQLDLQLLMVTMNKTQQDAVRSNPVEALRMYGWLKKMAQLAEKEGLHKESPYQQRIEMGRLTVLSEAIIQRQEQNDVLPPETLKGYYERMKDQFSSANLKLIYLSFTNETEELQAKKKAEELHTKLKAGADFVALVKEHSKDQTTREKDGDYPPVKRSDDIPETVKKTIFGLKPGEISQPLRLPNGYYLFKLISFKEESYAEVKDKLYVDVKQQRSRDWMQKMRMGVDVKVASPAK